MGISGGPMFCQDSKGLMTMTMTMRMMMDRWSLMGGGLIGKLVLHKDSTVFILSRAGNKLEVP